MKAAYIDATGSPDQIIYGDLPTPEPGPGQVLVEVAAVSVNPIDTYIRAGAVAMPLKYPFVVGCDLAGKVVKLGPQTRRYKVGDRVWGTNQGLLGRQGTFAEFAAVDEQWLYPTPTGVSDEAAAATALVGITAHLGLVQYAGLESDEVLFVNGGAGGVGSVVVQMAKALAPASSPRPAATPSWPFAASRAPTWRSTTSRKTSMPECAPSLRRGSTSGGKRCANRTSTAPSDYWPSKAE